MWQDFLRGMWMQSWWARGRDACQGGWIEGIGSIQFVFCWQYPHLFEGQTRFSMFEITAFCSTFLSFMFKSLIKVMIAFLVNIILPSSLICTWNSYPYFMCPPLFLWLYVMSLFPNIPESYIESTRICILRPQLERPWECAEAVYWGGCRTDEFVASTFSLSATNTWCSFKGGSCGDMHTQLIFWIAST